MTFWAMTGKTGRVATLKARAAERRAEARGVFTDEAFESVGC